MIHECAVPERFIEVEALLQEYPFLGTQKEVGYILQKVTLSQVHGQFSTQETRPIVNCRKPGTESHVNGIVVERTVPSNLPHVTS